jgi:uncharacterized protein
LSFVFTIAAVAVGASIVLTLLVRLGWLVARRRPARFWKKALIAHAVIVPVCVFLVPPAFMAVFFSSRIGTRGDERAYAGPRISSDGTWVLQTRESLLAEKTKAAVPDPALVASANAHTVTITTEDGVPLRAFLVAPKGTPRCTVVLLHGFFRGGLELEPPAAMFRDLGAETLMVETRHHGESGRAPYTFGRDEKRDVVAAVNWLRRAPERKGRPLVLFAVSLGTAAVIRAVPEVAPLAGVVLDAPMDALLATAHRMLSEEPRPNRRRLGIWQPFRSLTILAIELWSGVWFSEVRPIDDLARFPADMPVLVIGGSADLRMPPATVEAMFERLPTRPDLKLLWIRPGSTHGQVWTDDPAGYREQLARLLALAAP